MKYISIDIETTGLDTKFDQILEIGAVLDDTENQIDLDLLPKFHCYVISRNNVYHGNPFALSMNSDIFLKLANKDALKDEHRFIGSSFVAEHYSNWLNIHKIEKATYAGKNAGSFDLPFLDNYIPGFSNLKRRHRVIDPGNLFVDFHADNELPDLQKCLDRANLGAKTKEHTSIGDALDVIKLVRYKVSQQAFDFANKG